LATVLALVVGFLLGTASSRHFGSTDLANALRASDFNNRLTMLRVFRNKAPNAEEIPSMEIGAVVLLSNVQLDKVSKGSTAAAVLQKSAEYLVAYRRDFPKNEFDPKRHEEVARLMSWSEQH
jgi:hypothetical protein